MIEFMIRDQDQWNFDGLITQVEAFAKELHSCRESTVRLGIPFEGDPGVN